MSDIFVSTSLSDGSSVALVEAISCGLPIVATKVPAFFEWIEDGSNGRFIDFGDSLNLSKVINDLTGIVPELMVKEGVTSQKTIETLEEDNAIRFLVLAAAEADQPGPLVSLLAGQKSGKLPVPIVIIPQGLTENLIDDLASRSD